MKINVLNVWKEGVNLGKSDIKAGEYAINLCCSHNSLRKVD
jgi:hypothetical protein